jgi:1-acyl-sn-glycerol-3-phosphate acyltransferase
MGDAEIIPLGTRGRPGRGTGRERPSSSSRDLAGKPAAPRDDAPTDAPAAEPAADKAVPEPEVAQVEPTDTGVGDRPDTESAPPADVPADVPADAPAGAGTRTTAPALTSPPKPAGLLGSLVELPVAELMSAATRAAQVVFGEDAERKLAELLAFLRRRLTGDYVVDEYGMDPEITERFLLELVRPLATKWFRVEVRGVENIPTEGGALVVGNHSGTIPVDGLITMFAVHETTGRHLRPLGADLVFKMPFVGELARKAGATLACNEDATRMLSKGELAAVWPEGFKGVGKPYSERYKLQRFGRGGFVSAAIKTGVPIVPCSIVGAEEIYPLIGNIPVLARLLGVPYVPVTPFFPLLGPLGLVPLPSKWIIEFGEPIRTDSYDPGAADDPMLVFNVTDQVRETIQQTLYSLLMRRKSIFH